MRGHDADSSTSANQTGPGREGAADETRRRCAFAGLPKPPTRRSHDTRRDRRDADWSPRASRHHGERRPGNSSCRGGSLGTKQAGVATAGTASKRGGESSRRDWPRQSRFARTASKRVGTRTRTQLVSTRSRHRRGVKLWDVAAHPTITKDNLSRRRSQGPDMVTRVIVPTEATRGDSRRRVRRN